MWKIKIKYFSYNSAPTCLSLWTLELALWLWSAESSLYKLELKKKKAKQTTMISVPTGGEQIFFRLAK